MKEIEIKKMNGIEYGYMVFLTSYLNPIANTKMLSENLREMVKEPTNIIFDLLLANGDSFNRFAKGFFDGEKIDINSIEIVDADTDIKNESYKYYKIHKKYLSKSVLSFGEASNFILN
ncbi:type II toxin-antitoxin system RnlB family antitoxin [[Clostridium] fimetarium]|uniref:Antitoxin to toxin RNase LS or RnlA n=1 Tax=[Clostridium] fimetarium TaxID=99656 RepID=A0A1I0M068_9FIRM|nr:type II toxin-antitoxin system RnlB family antitoxin [[Clostridium] fimetarium]SEV81793.1 Antitoxin to toxin RNase LS or RnlA [[Clostridium] fimetarium]